MNSKFKLLITFSFLLSSINVCAQTPTKAGVLPSLNFGQKLKNDYDLTFNYQSRHFLLDNNSENNGNFGYQYALTDVSAYVGKKAGLNSKFVLGFLTRIEPEAMSYRIIQRYILQSKIHSLRASHRIVTDQTFTSAESPTFRLRYRFSTEVPLSGQKVDVKEFYFKVSTEAINSLQDNLYDLEFRLVPNIGYVLNDQHKVEIGLDNRLGTLIQNQANFTSWLTIAWFL